MNEASAASTFRRQQRIAECLAAYEGGRENGPGDLRQFVERLADPDDRRAALQALVQADLEFQWRSGRPIPLEEYLGRYPELGAPDSVCVELIGAEIAARRGSGRPADEAELRRRFPSRSSDIRHLLKQFRDGAPDEQTVLAPDDVSGPSGDNSRSEDQRLAEPRLGTARKVVGSGTRPVSADGRGSGADYRLPSPFGRYEIVRTIDSGHMGVVVQAYDPQLDRHVALKVPRDADDPDVRARFLREARAAATIRHTHVCPIYDVGEVEGRPYLTMAYIEGSSLARKIDSEGPLSGVETVRLIRKLAVALAEPHKRGIIHRDLKPANVLIDTDGEPVITDFGLARRLNAEDASLTQTGCLLGTPAYMSPEQVDGNRQDVGAKSDLYSLGVIMYELLTGRRPFSGPITTLLLQIATKEPESPLVHRPELDPELGEICMKLMAKDPSDRYESAQQLADELDRWLSASGFEPASHRRSKSTEAEPSRPAHPDRREGRKSLVRGTRPLIWFSGAIVFVTAAFLAVYLFSSNHTSPSASPEGAHLRSGSSQERSTPLPPRLPPPGLAIHFQRAEQNSGYQVLSGQPDQLPLHEGDKVQLFVTTPQPAYVYLYWIDEEGVIERLWPQQLDSQELVQAELWNPPLAPTGEVQDWHVLGGKPGPECVLAALSEEPIPADQLAELERHRVVFAQRAGGFNPPAPGRLRPFAGPPEDSGDNAPMAALVLDEHSETELVQFSSDNPLPGTPAGDQTYSLKPGSAEVVGLESLLASRFSSYRGLVVPFRP